MITKKLGATLMMAAFLLGCTGVPGALKPISDFDMKKYLGSWYEIARLDHPFERGLSNVSAVYTLVDDDTIKVANKGFDQSNSRWKEARGKAHFLGDESVGSLKVSFFGPFYSGYHIIALDREHYQYAMVTGPSRSYLWILSRKRMLDDDIFNDLILQAEKWGFDTKKLIRVKHDK